MAAGVAIDGPLQPGETIGILGGGQLGRMLAMAAAKLGYRTVIFDPDPDAPATQVANRHIKAEYDDIAALDDFAAACSMATYEFENVPVETVRWVAKYRPVQPNAESLLTSQDRVAEKSFLNAIGIATAPWAAIWKPDEFNAALAKAGTPSILKTRRFGYDGKGQAPVLAAGDLPAAWREIGQVPAILEGYVEFDLEISVIAARSAEGQFRAFDPPFNRHAGGILRSSSVPAPIGAATAATATEIARKIMDALNYCGVMGIEFFVESDGQLKVNEIAPRVHNSGHWTEAACLVSQFEQHIRAIAGLPLGNSARHSDCVMENIIGDDMRYLPLWQAEADCHIHLYGKKEIRPGRKMGHLTRLRTLGGGPA